MPKISQISAKNSKPVSFFELQIWADPPLLTIY